MPTLRVFTPGAERQDAEWALWKGGGYPDAVPTPTFVSAPTTTTVAEFKEEAEGSNQAKSNVAASAACALVTHAVVLERLTDRWQ